MVCVNIKLLGFFWSAIGHDIVLVAFLRIVPISAPAADQEEGNDASNEDGDDDPDHDWYDCGGITWNVYTLKNKIISY